MIPPRNPTANKYRAIVAGIGMIYVSSPGLYAGCFQLNFRARSVANVQNQSFDENPGMQRWLGLNVAPPTHQLQHGWSPSPPGPTQRPSQPVEPGLISLPKTR